MERVLTKTIEYLCLSEEEAEEIVTKAKAENVVESSSVKFKKATKKKMEHWIVVIKSRLEYPEFFTEEYSED